MIDILTQCQIISGACAILGLMYVLYNVLNMMRQLERRISILEMEKLKHYDS